MKIFINNEEVEVIVSKYKNERPAIFLVDELNLPYATCTINVPDEDVSVEFAVIKNYSENAGIMELLEEHNIVTKTGVYPLSFNVVPVCVVNPESEWI